MHIEVSVAYVPVLIGARSVEAPRMRTGREPPIEATRVDPRIEHKGEANGRRRTAPGKRSLLVMSPNTLRWFAAPMAGSSNVVEFCRDVSVLDRSTNIVGVYRLPRALKQ
jgi:hypothetical protein